MASTVLLNRRHFIKNATTDSEAGAFCCSHEQTLAGMQIIFPPSFY